MLTECDHLRVTDDSDLLAEVSYWKCLSKKLNFILVRIKEEDCLAVLSFLHEARCSDLIKVLILGLFELSHLDNAAVVPI